VQQCIYLSDVLSVAQFEYTHDLLYFKYLTDINLCENAIFRKINKDINDFEKEVEE
jgi:ssRNA-specific RNase YbeY (16S rRNA maturation enzyme)